MSGKITKVGKKLQNFMENLSKLDSMFRENNAKIRMQEKRMNDLEQYSKW